MNRRREDDAQANVIIFLNDTTMTLEIRLRFYSEALYDRPLEAGDAKSMSIYVYVILAHLLPRYERLNGSR